MSGLELLYMNDERDDFAQYYDRETFQAFKALSPRPHWADPSRWDYAIEERAAEVQDMLAGDNCRVYVAGKSDILETLDKVFAGPGRLGRCLAASARSGCAPSGAGSSWCTERVSPARRRRDPSASRMRHATRSRRTP